MWLVLHDRALSNSNRMKRHLTDDPRCKRCSTDADETLLHLLRYCPAARSIWKSVGGAANYPSFFDGDLTTWITRNIKVDGLIYFDKRPVCLALSLWWNCRWRNNFLFGRQNDIPIDTGSFIRTSVEESWAATCGVDEGNPLRMHLLHREGKPLYVGLLHQRIGWP